MIRIQVKNSNFTTRKWIDKTTGSERSMNIQQLLVYLCNSDGVVDETPDKVELILNAGQSPFPVGNYQLSPSCVYLDRNGRLQIGLSNIQPVAQKVSQAA